MHLSFSPDQFLAFLLRISLRGEFFGAWITVLYFRQLPVMSTGNKVFKSIARVLGAAVIVAIQHWRMSSRVDDQDAQWCHNLQGGKPMNTCYSRTYIWLSLAAFVSAITPYTITSQDSTQSILPTVSLLTVACQCLFLIEWNFLSRASVMMGVIYLSASVIVTFAPSLTTNDSVPINFRASVSVPRATFVTASPRR